MALYGLPETKYDDVKFLNIVASVILEEELNLIFSEDRNKYYLLAYLMYHKGYPRNRGFDYSKDGLRCWGLFHDLFSDKNGEDMGVLKEDYIRKLKQMRSTYVSLQEKFPELSKYEILERWCFSNKNVDYAYSKNLNKMEEFRVYYNANFAVIDNTDWWRELCY